MNILFIGEPGQREEIESMKEKASSDLSFENLLPENVVKFNAIFFLNKKDFSDGDSKLWNKFILINDVCGNLPASSSIKIARFNGWPTFLKNNVWEVATNYREEFKSVFTALNREVLFVNDEPGLISARIVSQIINEAFYALNEGVSSKEEIDLAMKNGTNYPFGPFEWAKKIGLEKVHVLLSKLSEEDNSYSPAFTL